MITKNKNKKNCYFPY